MKKADTVKVDRGPRVALRLMKHLCISSIYVLDNANRLLGAVTAQDTVEAIESEKSLNDVIISDLPMISPEWSNDVTGRKDEITWISVYLIPAADVENFLEQIQQYEKGMKGMGWQFEATGPWPAYHFSNFS